MTSQFELFIASRYLRAHRKEKVISIITVISMLGVAVGVMALVMALGVNNGFRDTLQKNLLGAMAHIEVVPKVPGDGIENWQEVAANLRNVPHVTAVSPAVYSDIYIAGPLRPVGGQIKGINPDSELTIGDSLRNLKAGSIDRLRDQNASPPPIVVGSEMAEYTGTKLNSIVNVMAPDGELTPYGPKFSARRFRVVGIFETGFYEVDAHWAFTSILAAQKLLSTGDLVNDIQINVDDLHRATEFAKTIEQVAGPDNTTTTWLERNKQLLGALRMERIVTIITIGLIQLVAAFNIFITLVMMVMEKYRDIAVLMSMGARHSQVRRIFVTQGVLIGIVGSIIGLIAGYTLSYLADTHRWVPLDRTVYALSFVPFHPRPIDGVWIAGAAILVSFLATLYPSRNATRIAPAEVLRYE